MKLRWPLFAALSFSSAACAGLLGLRPSSPEHPFEHRAHVLEGIHCTRCHTGVAESGEKSALHLPDTNTCRSCHTSPHDENECSHCHGRAHTRRGAAEAREHLLFEHSTHVPRVKGDCVRCHLDISHNAGVLRPRMANCGSCHAHEKALASRDCDACHVDLRNEGTMPEDHFVHEGDFLKRHAIRAVSDRAMCTTCHSERFCAGCHGATAPMLPARLVFDQTMRSGVHRAGFASRHAEEARADPGLCTTCHSPTACADCHRTKELAAGAGKPSYHPPGWLGLPGQPNDHGRATWRDPALCASCHGGTGEKLCVGCHRVGAIGGNPHPPGWSSQMKRSDRPCRLCHEAG